VRIGHALMSLQSPDGYIYVATEGASGGNVADGMV
jgi:hypothetical protein